MGKPGRVWLFDLDDTLHNASQASLPQMMAAMGDYMVQELAIAADEVEALRRSYWQRYGATLLGLVRHHGVRVDHFLHQTHLLPGLEGRVRGHAADLAALRRLPGRKFILTNAPAAYATRVLAVLGIRGWFDGLVSIEDMHMFRHLRPKPDARMLRAVAARLGVPPHRCTLVEDTLVHQKAARSVGMDTVWMQRWLRAGPVVSAHKAVRLNRRPPYVDHRVRRLHSLLRQR